MNSAGNDSQQSAHSGRVRDYVKHLGSTLREAPFTGGTWLYLAIVLAGGAAATWFIPSINSSETSAETFGIYVIGILIAVFADALFLWKKSKDDVIAETIIVVSFVLSLVVGFLSVKEQFHTPEGVPGKRWRSYGELCIFLILLISILMWAMINVVEPRLNIAATDKPANYTQLNGK